MLSSIRSVLSIIQSGQGAPALDNGRVSICPVKNSSGENLETFWTRRRIFPHPPLSSEIEDVGDAWEVERSFAVQE